MSGEHDIIASTRDQLNEVGPGFCLAKWLQVTIHLHNGRTHSCHHPSPHHIPLDEIQKDPSALHNTQYKLQQQRDMVDGKRPKECQYCWNVEDLPGDHYSDRYLKSGDSQWAGVQHIGPIIEKTRRGEKVNPQYVEVSFSNVCNFKCSYCSPQFSSQWVHEIEKHGPYEMTEYNYNDIDYLKQTESFPIHHKEYNPYVDAFWKWWPDLVQDLKVFRITGGEPLLDKNTFKVMDMLDETPNTEMELSINSNLGVPDNIIDLYIEKMKALLSGNKIRRSVLYTSVDAHGKQAEYGRNGLDYTKWLANVDRILTELPQVKIVVMCTANIFSVNHDFINLVKDIYDLKIKHFNQDRLIAITLDMSILRWPRHQSVSILPAEYAGIMEPSLEYMVSKQENENGNDPYMGFFIFEIEKMRRFIETIRQPVNDAEQVNLVAAVNDFRTFVDEHDYRRGTDFFATFPELIDFYKELL